jgi:hypothetical protein
LLVFFELHTVHVEDYLCVHVYVYLKVTLR